MKCSWPLGPIIKFEEVRELNKNRKPTKNNLPIVPIALIVITLIALSFLISSISGGMHKRGGFVPSAKVWKELQARGGAKEPMPPIPMPGGGTFSGTRARETHAPIH